MRYSASEKLEIIRLVEQSHLPCGQGMEGLSNARRSRWGTKGQAEWKLPHGARTNDAVNAARLIGLLARLARD